MPPRSRGGLKAASLAVAATVAGGIASGCRYVDQAELTDTEKERILSLSLDSPADGSPARGLLLGLGLPPADRSNALVADPATAYPYDSESRTLAPGAQLGKRLYFDRGFSGVATLEDVLRRPTPYGRAPKGCAISVSCADCHDLSRAGADRNDLAVSIGAGWYDVNSQPTVNAAYYQLFYWNGRVDSLWAQIASVNVSRVSMNSSIPATTRRLLTSYGDEYRAVFGGTVRCAGGTEVEVGDADTLAAADLEVSGGTAGALPCSTRVYVNFAKAIAAYEHALVHAASPFDRFVDDVRAGRDSTAISGSAKRGARLFVGKAGCIDCHNTPLFTDNKFHNVGIPQVGAAVPTLADCAADPTCTCNETLGTTETKAAKCPPWGGWDGLWKLRQHPYRRQSEWSDDRGDSSRCQFISDSGWAKAGSNPPEPCPADASSVGGGEPGGPRPGYGVPDLLDSGLIGSWRTPSLRDVALTAPYMHNGVYRTLEEVVWHYNGGGMTDSLDPHARRAVQIAPLRLTEDEQRDLVELLKTLTGEPLPPDIVAPPDGVAAAPPPGCAVPDGGMP
jgi:cytochrome c peroxidase